MIQALLTGYLLAFVCLYGTWLSDRAQEASLDSKLMATAIAFLPFFGALFWFLFFRAPPPLNKNTMAAVSDKLPLGAQLVGKEMKRSAEQRQHYNMNSGDLPPVFVKVYRYLVLPLVFLLVALFNILFWTS